MRDGWRSEPLSELLELIIDHRGKTPKKLGGDFTQHGVPVVSAIHIKGGRIDWSERSRFVTNEMYRRWMPNPVRTNDVLLTSEAPLGQLAIVPSDEELVLSQRLFALRGKSRTLHGPYLYYYLQSPEGQAALSNRATGTTVLGIRQSELLMVRVAHPSFDEQRRIAEVLGALDDLIDTNEQIARRVRELSALAYRRVKSTANSTIRLGEVAAVNARQTRAATGGTLTYLDIASVGDGTIDWPQPIRWVDAPSRARRLAQSGSTLWSTVRPNRRAHALLVSSRSDLVVSTGLAVLTPRTIGPAELFAATDDDEFVDFLIRRAEGSAYPAVRGNVFEDAPLARLDSSISADFESQLWPLWQAVDALQTENVQLRRTRDELLPLLMSGKVRVRDLESA